MTIGRKPPVFFLRAMSIPPNRRSLILIYYYYYYYKSFYYKNKHYAYNFKSQYISRLPLVRVNCGFYERTTESHSVEASYCYGETLKKEAGLSRFACCLGKMTA